MTETEIREIFDRARTRTSLKEAKLSLIIQDEKKWILLFESKGEELAIEIPEEAAATKESFQEAIRVELMRLS